MNKISIKKIAEICDVSIATVSRVLNNTGRFSEETREKVMNVVKDTGYQTNTVAKSLRVKKTFSIGIVVPDITNFFFADIIQNIEKRFFENGYSTIICTTERNPEKEELYIQNLQRKMIDGLIVLSGNNFFDFKNINPDLPVVCIDRKPKNNDSCTFISSAHYQGAYSATQHLLANDCINPVIIKHDRQTSSSIARLKGFKNCLEDNNINFNPDVHLITVSSNNKPISVKKTAISLEKYLANNQLMDGIFAINDYLGYYSVNFLLSKNISVPGDVKVIGFDDSPLASLCTPRLSSVRQDTKKIADETCNVLLKLISGSDFNNKQKTIPVEIIKRESSKSH